MARFTTSGGSKKPTKKPTSSSSKKPTKKPTTTSSKKPSKGGSASAGLGIGGSIARPSKPSKSPTAPSGNRKEPVKKPGGASASTGVGGSIAKPKPGGAANAGVGVGGSLSKPSSSGKKPSSSSSSSKRPSSSSGGSSVVTRPSGGGSSSSSASTSKVEPLEVIEKWERPRYTAAELAEMYGAIYGEEEFLKRLQDATNAKFNEYDSQTRKLRDEALTDYASQYDQYLNTIRNQKANSLQQGITKGASMANEVSTLLGAQSISSANQNQYQEQLGELVDARASQLASDKYTAMNLQNELAMKLANVGQQAEATDVQDQIGYYQYLASMAQAEVQNKLYQYQAEADAKNQAMYAGMRANTYGAGALSASKGAGASDLSGYLQNSGLDDDLIYMVSYGAMDGATAYAIQAQSDESAKANLGKGGPANAATGAGGSMLKPTSSNKNNTGYFGSTANRYNNANSITSNAWKPQTSWAYKY